MASSWKITRGVKRNRIDRVRKSRARTLDVSPQRAVARQRSTGEEIWTQICLSAKASDLSAIDDRADELGMSRSAFMIKAALVACGFKVWEVE